MSASNIYRAVLSSEVEGKLTLLFALNIVVPQILIVMSFHVVKHDFTLAKGKPYISPCFANLGSIPSLKKYLPFVVLTVTFLNINMNFVFYKSILFHLCLCVKF